MAKNHKLSGGEELKDKGYGLYRKKMPEKWRRHFMLYRAKISIYLDTPDFGLPLMLDASDIMDFLPHNTDQASFVGQIGPAKPGAEALWIEAALPEGTPSRPNARRMGAMVHQSKVRTNIMREAWTGADNEYRVEAYVRDKDGLSVKLEPEVRFRLDAGGFLEEVEFISYERVSRPDSGFKDAGFSTFVSDYGTSDPEKLPVLEMVNRVFFVLALMNCRNVELRERTTTRGSREANATGDAFHEVVIDGKAGALKNSDADGTSTSRNHLARGHFKTFTEDAPLLGKHVGTYWWGWQVRGQECKGSIDKVYTLK